MLAKKKKKYQGFTLLEMMDTKYTYSVKRHCITISSSFNVICFIS